MPVIGSLVSDKPKSGSTTKIALEDDTYTGVIKKIAFFHEDAEKKIVDGADPNKVRVSVQLDVADNRGEPIVLSRKMTLSTYENAAFAGFLSVATGIPVKDEAALKRIDTDALIDAPIRVLTKYDANRGYTNIDKFLAPKQRGSQATRTAPQSATESPAQFDADDLLDEYDQHERAA